MTRARASKVVPKIAKKVGTAARIATACALSKPIFRKALESVHAMIISPHVTDTTSLAIAVRGTTLLDGRLDDRHNFTCNRKDRSSLAWRARARNLEMRNDRHNFAFVSVDCCAAAPDQRLKADRPRCEPVTDWRPAVGTARADVRSHGHIAVPTFFWGGMGPPRRRQLPSPLA